jgi:ribosomal-protein-alanine N-acetyltransferase
MIPTHWYLSIFRRRELSTVNDPSIPFLIEPMRPADTPQVIAIEQAAYTMRWPRKAYNYELEQNELAHYFVLRPATPDPSEKPDPIGLAGFWLMADEAHINTLAIHPAWRRLGLGEWLLLTLIEQAQAQGASVATLEVRPSNQAALSLYQKYDFQEVGRRPGYYSDDGEDALILTSLPLSSLDYQAMLRQRKATLVQRLAKIEVDKTEQIR